VKRGLFVCRRRVTPVVNPRKSVVQMHADSWLYTRAHTRDLADIAKRQGKAIAIAADNPLDDGLIARPN
jgi:hypothetical protein